MKTSRNILIDAIKGVAITVVALYHFDEILPYGYLGVDVFFVIGGYFLLKQLDKQMQDNCFNYWKYIWGKVARLWPLIIISASISFLIGYFVMLPDDFENLSESIVASSFFLNNVLQCITTKDYWDIVNQYKPLMHFWYVGVLMKIYIILPPLYVLITHRIKRKRKGLFFSTIVTSSISLVMFLLPIFSAAWKFYYFPFRLFEVTLGGTVALVNIKINNKERRVVLFFALLSLAVMLCTRKAIVCPTFMLISTVLCSVVLVWVCSMEDCDDFAGKRIIRIGASIGKCSYSIYIWHQIIIAFLFYSVFPEKNVISFLVFLVLTILVSFVSYRCFEIPIEKLIKKEITERIVIGLTGSVAIVICILAFYVYCNAGVVRDVPELNITKELAHRHMHSEYCDRPYSWDIDFSDDNKTHVLVIGNSFARDWANVLYEYDEGKKNLVISYIFYSEEYSDSNLMSYMERIESADFVFLSKFGGTDSITIIPPEKMYLIGNKNYGTSNGIIYSRRFTHDYYSQTVEISEDLIEENIVDYEKYKEHYIDLMTPVMISSNRVRCFTDDNKYISQDCRHLTQAGARYYARIMCLDKLFMY